MKRPLRRGTVPVGGYCRYKDPDAGFEVKHPYYDFCKGMAKQGRVERGLAIPFDWDAFFDEQFCKATPQACVDVPDAPRETGPSWTRLAIQFGASMMGWAKSGFRVVSWEGFKRRYEQCTGDGVSVPRCVHFNRFAGTGVTRCGKCGCTSLKLFLASEKCPIGKW